MEQQIFQLLVHAEYEQAAALLQGCDSAQIRDILLQIACDKDSMAVIGFAQHLFTVTGDYFWYDCMITLLAGPLCFVEGAYALAYRCARLVLAHERSEENLVQLLFFNDIPERLLPDPAARAIAQEVLSVNPEHPVAARILQRLN